MSKFNQRSGEVEEVGEESKQFGWKKGDRVCALLGGGGYAQYVLRMMNCDLSLTIQ